jgi:tRNA(Ile)-lysidine synthase
MIHTIHQYIEQHSLLKPGERVLVAYSGGPDSTFLLQTLHGWWPETAAVYVNHRLRASESADEEAFVRRFCKERGISLFVEQLSWKQKPSNLEEAARKRRYRHLEKVAREKGFDKIALAHHADDLVETFLLRLFRGSGPSGLVPMQPQRGKYIRPLLGSRRNQIVDYLSEHDIPYFADSTNSDLHFQRNRIRHELLPYIEKHWNPRISTAILRTVQWLDEQNKLLADFTLPFQGLIERKGDLVIIDHESWKKLSLPLRKIILKGALIQAGLMLSPSARTIDRLLQTIEKKRKMELAGFVMVESKSRSIEFSRKTGQIGYYELDVPAEGTYRFSPANALLHFSVEKGSGYQKLKDVAYLDWSKASFPLHIRNWKKGDRFRPLGMKGSKKVSDFLIDSKVPRSERKRVPLVFKDDDLIWIAGHQINDLYRVTPGTRKMLRIELKHV